MILRPGTSNTEYVAALQQLLVNAELYAGAVDGQYTDEVREAVEDWQEAYNAAHGLTDSAEDDDGSLLVDGIAGSLTLAAMGFGFADDNDGNHIEQAVEDSEHSHSNAFDAMEIVEACLPLWDESVRDNVMVHFSHALEPLRDYLDDLHLNTPLMWAHALGQMREETGGKFSTIENLNYRDTALPKLFKVYRSNGKASEHGRTKSKAADQQAIAECAYAGRIGNGAEGCGDGALFMGGGCHQTTGRANYQEFHDWLLETLPEVYAAVGGERIMTEGAVALSEPPLAVLSMVGFWYRNQLFEAVDGMNRESSERMTDIINKHIGADSRANRWKHTLSAAKLMGIA